ncbi:PepSY-like domain-containing protein [Lutibacter sp. A80]|uniref:PepSY-like domain-containing protein n=1 Tax=Lutibacter sp. A80 TaxID=2918453 RepID=UPI001F056C79|nr:PepSY-like domain-containing protein [Lutibacter sp. A80]UMB61312.1 PepSY-like domain-containing protein [Lutibacter sp. A80]
MKSKIYFLAIALCICSTIVTAQDIPQNQVPSLVINNFKKKFPKAKDIEWEYKKNNYNVEFEIGLFTDFEAWYDNSGKLIKYSEEISKRNLPKIIQENIKKNYQNYHIDNIEKVVENNSIIYYVEIEKGNNEINLKYLENGKLI